MGVLQLLLPPACAGCGRYGAALCDRCRTSLPLLSAPADLLAPDPGVVVGDAVTLSLAAFAHRDATQHILRRRKYGGARHLAAPLAHLASPALRRLLEISGPAVLVPVPLHAERRRERGYNQAELLATALAGRAGLPLWLALTRRRATVRQHALDRASRIRNLTEVMALAGPLPPALAAGESAVIIVDDILTTGATMEACARVLQEAGVGSVFGFVIAREI